MLDESAGKFVFLDLAVYADGASRVVTGGELYTQESGALPYTYPPVSAFVFALWHFLPTGVGEVLMAAMSLLCAGRVVQLCAERYRGEMPVILLAVPFLVYFPMWSTLTFGQVNLWLLWLVCEDLLGSRGSRWRGVGLGLAAAIKLTPLFFVAVLVFTPLRGTVLRAVGWFCAFTAASALVLWEESVLYWTELIHDPERIGNLDYPANQSMNGVLWRLIGEDGSSIAWFGLSTVVGVACIFVCRSVLAPSSPGIQADGGPPRQSGIVAAIAVIGVGMLLCSPVTWAHHWVWAIPALTILLCHLCHTHSVVDIVFLATAVAIFAVFNMNWLNRQVNPEQGLTVTQQILAMSYVVWGVAYLAWHVTAVVRETRETKQPAENQAS